MPKYGNFENRPVILENRCPLGENKLNFNPSRLERMYIYICATLASDQYGSQVERQGPWASC